MAKKKGAESDQLSPVRLDVQGEFLDIPNFYCNVSTVRLTDDDVSILFSQQLEREADLLKVAPQAIVFMSPRHAKRLLELLERVVGQHELKHGPLPSGGPPIPVT